MGCHKMSSALELTAKPVGVRLSIPPSMRLVYCVSDVLMTPDEVGGEGKIATCSRFQQMIALQRQEADTRAEPW